MSEMFTPYLLKSNRRKTSQEHPSTKERSSMLKTLRTAGTMYILSTPSHKNTLRVKERWEGLFFSLHTLCIEKSHPYLWLKISFHKICRAEYMRGLLRKYKIPRGCKKPTLKTPRKQFIVSFPLDIKYNTKAMWGSILLPPNSVQLLKRSPYKTPRRDNLLKGQSLLSPFSPRSTLMQTQSTDL